MATQEEESRQIEIENEIMLCLNKLYFLLQESDKIEAEEQLGYVAQWKVFWEDGIPIDEQEA